MDIVNTLPKNHNTSYPIDKLTANVKELLLESPFSEKNIIVSEGDDYYGKKISLFIQEDNVNNIMDETLKLYYSVSEECASKAGIPYYEINIYNHNNEQVLYFAGDYVFGNSISWISPLIEEQFIKDNGPKS